MQRRMRGSWQLIFLQLGRYNHCFKILVAQFPCCYCDFIIIIQICDVVTSSACVISPVIQGWSRINSGAKQLEQIGYVILFDSYINVSPPLVNEMYIAVRISSFMVTPDLL